MSRSDRRRASKHRRQEVRRALENPDDCHLRNRPIRKRGGWPKDDQGDISNDPVSFQGSLSELPGAGDSNRCGHGAEAVGLSSAGGSEAGSDG